MTLEERVAELERRLGEEARLRASVDGDLANVTTSMRAMRHLVQAVSITQGEHTSTLLHHSELLLRLHSGVTQIIGMLDDLARRDDDGGPT